MLEYVVFPKVVLLVYKTYIECLMYPRQELAGSRRGFKGVTTTSINPLLSCTPLARNLKYI